MPHGSKLGYTLVGALFVAIAPLWLAQGEDPQIKKKMARWKTEVGVKCDYCHVQKPDKKWDYEAETPRKKIAHVCEENYVKKLELPGGKKIGCVDCHQRKARFLPRPAGELPPVATSPVGPEPEDGDKKEEEKEKD